MKTSNWFFRVLNWIALLSVGIGLVFIIVGIISAWVGRLFPDTESINFFIASSNFFIIAIALMVFQIKNQLTKEG
jgi:nicotinamide riboside transporter PnuC